MSRPGDDNPDEYPPIYWLGLVGFPPEACVLLWLLALATLTACSQPMPAGEPMPDPKPNPPAREETSRTATESGRVRRARDAQLGDHWGLFPFTTDNAACASSQEKKREGMYEEESAFEEAAIRTRNEEAARRARRAPAPESERANAKPWKTLPPARVSQSADDCIGYCFDAVLGAVDEKDWRVAQVVVFDKKGRPTRAIVERTRVRGFEPEVRYTCFDRTMDGKVPRFTDCQQTRRGENSAVASKGADDEAGDWADDPMGDGPFLDF